MRYYISVLQWAAKSYKATKFEVFKNILTTCNFAALGIGTCSASELKAPICINLDLGRERRSNTFKLCRKILKNAILLQKQALVQFHTNRTKSIGKQNKTIKINSKSACILLKILNFNQYLFSISVIRRI